MQRRFIHALAACGSVAEACRVVGRCTSGAYRLRARPGSQAFRDAWAAATAMAYRQVLNLAMDRVVGGIEEPVYHNGEQVGFKTTHSDRLLCYMLGHLRSAPPAYGGAAAHRDRPDYELAAALCELPDDDDAPLTEEAAAVIDAEGMAMMDWRDEVLGPLVPEPVGPTDAEWQAMTDEQRTLYYRTGAFETLAVAVGGTEAAAAPAAARALL